MTNSRRKYRVPLITSLLALYATHGSCGDFKKQCLSFNPNYSLPNTTVRIIQYLPPNTTLPFSKTESSCNQQSQSFTPEACRITLTVPTSNRSSTIVEYFFPRSDAWTGRLLATGNGGLDGCIKYDDIAYGVSLGFATTGSNNGHNGTGGQAFFDNPDVVTDFSYRSLHVSTVTGKALTEAFYGRAQSRSYYIGCSGGGRQGVQATSLYPEDYDGVLVGAPALNFNFLSGWRASFYTITGSANSPGFISAKTWAGLIHNEVLRQCDELDGVKDGILNDPARCAALFSPTTLLCRDNSTSTCLTPEQINIVRTVYAPYMDNAFGLIYPGFAPGGEILGSQGLLSGNPFQNSVNWFRYAVYSNASWDPSTYTALDAINADRLNPGNARTWPSSLPAFNSRGGKMLVYHGGADQQITPFDTERWYSYLNQGSSSTQLDDFLRFFRIPGHSHCVGGNGAWQAGQSAEGAAGIPFVGQMNMLAALVEWVEGGTAPEVVVGTKFVDDNPLKGVQMKRPHCKFPQSSIYLGGDNTLPGSWKCA